MDENDIVVFMKGTVNQPMCGFSRLAVKILHVNNVPRITSVNVLEADELRDGIKQFSQVYHYSLKLNTLNFIPFLSYINNTYLLILT